MKFTIGITLRTAEVGPHNEQRDMIATDWYALFERYQQSYDFLLIPNLGKSTSGYLDRHRMDALLLSGGEDIGQQPQRDLSERSAIDSFLKRGAPIIGVCRGAQMLNMHFGGKNERSNDDSHAGNIHRVNLKEHMLNGYTGERNFLVNSYHKFVIRPKDLSQTLSVVADAEDQTIEAFIDQNRRIFGMQWHPERSEGGPEVFDFVMQHMLRDWLKQ